MVANPIKSLIDQQSGFSRWRNSDTIVKRLHCVKENAYTHMYSTDRRQEDDLVRDTPIFACKFAQQEGNEHFVGLANEDGKLAIHNTENSSRYGVDAHNNAIFDLAWTFGEMKIVTASGDHSAVMFDIGNGEIRREGTYLGHTRSVKTVAFQKDCSNIFATGGRDGNIFIWDRRSGIGDVVGLSKPDNQIVHSHYYKMVTPQKIRKKSCNTPTRANIKSVTGLVFQNDSTLISCGAGDGLIKVWDLRKNYAIHKKDAVPKYIIPYSGSTSKNGFSSLIMDKNAIKLYANCLDNTIYCYNLSTYNSEPVKCYTGHQNNTFYIKSSLCNEGQYLVSGSSDENAYIWDIDYSRPIVKLTGHHAEVTCVAWCCNSSKTLITCSDDMTHKIWTVGPEELPSDWDLTGMGRAEILPLEIKHRKKRTIIPTQNEENNLDTPKRMTFHCELCDTPTVNLFLCENCNEPTSSKRKASDTLCSENKIRLTSEFGPRRLFANLNNHNLPTLPEEDDDEEPPLKKRYVEEISPPRSPTVNLPNYNIDGVAPHLHFSPQKRRNMDWLTKMRIERQLKQDMEEKTNGGPSSPKIPKVESHVIPKSDRLKSPLLRFFKVTNRCDGISCSRAHCSNYSSPSRQSSQ